MDYSLIKYRSNDLVFIHSGDSAGRGGGNKVTSNYMYNALSFYIIAKFAAYITKLHS